MFGNSRKTDKLSGGISDDLAPDLKESIDDSNVERGQVSPVAAKKKNSVNTVFKTIGLVIGLLIVLFSLINIMGGDESETNKEQQAPPETTFKRGERLDLERYVSPPAPPPSLASVTVPEETGAVPTEEVTTTGGVAVNTNTTTTTQQVTAAENTVPNRKMTGSVLANVGGSKSSESAAEAAKREKPQVVPARMAAKRADRTYLLKKGTNIPCTLNTKIVTTHAGMTRCITSKDIYSADGKIVLLERGSEIIGEQTTGLKQGQARVFVLWTQVETPNGVVLDIDSPSADSLGASGQEAQVDTHFWKRFGGAIMLSMIDDFAAIAADRNKDNRYNFDNTSDSAQEMAAIALENTINIPPTGYVNQGTLVNVMVAQDVDFSDVYELVNPYYGYN
ncbi:hypothetical protein AAEX37_01065 [Oligella sp. MSHR50489EDL]|uniref:type IV secretion system protein VirB10 n=1 Tax=Oligella sp. MSHR50489EDL TaxID=3139409 RepID=UPI003D816C05